MAREVPKDPAAPMLLVAQSAFNERDGKPVPAPARLEILQPVEWGWAKARLEDPESNVFHKALPWEGGILTIGAESAKLKHWTLQGGAWQEALLYEGSWGGKFDRLRDVEHADFDGDGQEELVLATHDQGVVVYLDRVDGVWKATEMDKRADTFVHEVEVGDVDGDGTLEFATTPSARNQADTSQPGGVDLYRRIDGAWVREEVARWDHSHAKEILMADLDGDGRSELMAVMEAELNPATKAIVTPVEIRRFQKGPTGWTHSTMATISDRQTRFLVPGDFDHDGRTELVAATMSAGLFLIEPPTEGIDGPWSAARFDADSGGFEHAAVGADLDGDGELELYVAADRQKELRRYLWNTERGTFDRETIGRFEGRIFTWNLVGSR